MSLSLARLLYRASIWGGGVAECAGIVTSLLCYYTHFEPSQPRIENENGSSTKHAAFYKLYVVQVWFEPARVQVIRSQRLNHSAMRDADMRCNYNIYFSPSRRECWKHRPTVLWNSVDWLRFDTEDMEKKPQSLEGLVYNYPAVVENVFQLRQDVET